MLKNEAFSAEQRGALAVGATTLRPNIGDHIIRQFYWIDTTVKLGLYNQRNLPNIYYYSFDFSKDITVEFNPLHLNPNPENHVKID